MSNSSFPVSKRNLPGGGVARNSKKNTPSLYENVAVQIPSALIEPPGSPLDNQLPKFETLPMEVAGSAPVPSGNRHQFMALASPVIPLAESAVIASVSNGDSQIAVPNTPLSPGSNRQRFMENCQPLQVCCDLATVGMHNTSVRFSFTAIVLVVFPETKNPERRHIQLIDQRGSTGLTLWNDNVRMFSTASVGLVVKFTKLAMVFVNGKKSLSMGRDSTVSFVNTVAVPTEESKWWRSLLLCKPLRIIDVHDCEVDVVISVSGIVGLIYTERKRVKDQDRDLLCMRMTDMTGFIDIRSWTHSEQEFAHFLEQPMMLQRVRVCSFAGTKTLELLSGTGTIVVEEFEGKRELQKYWAE
jgi:hypothetical protein